ncbi:MAG TPA: hypothetical protein VIU64_15965 [Polyangia bacterium]
MRSSLTNLISRRTIPFFAVLAMLLGPSLGLTGAAVTASAAEPTPVAATTVPGSSSTGAHTLPAGTPASGAESYETREAQSKSLETFKGGAPVVIYTSTAVLIALVIILIILI